MENDKGSMHSQPLLSVIIPVYNVEGYLDRCIRSVIQQSYNNLEIILVDDGSTDGSGVLCDRYAGIDSRVTVVHKENGGQVSARKEGIRRATGKYAAYVDSDDWIGQGMYQELLRLMEESDADLVTSGFFRDYGTHAFVQKERIMPGVYEKEELVENFLTKMISVDTFFLQNVFFIVWNKIYKTEYLREYQQEVDNFINVGEDVGMGYAYFLNAKKIVVSGKNYYHYCMRGDSVMGNRKEDEPLRYASLFRYIEKQCSRHVNRVPNIRKQAKIHKYYLMLLQCTEKVVWYKDGILFPFGQVSKQDTIVIYGAGRFGSVLKDVLEKRYGFQIIAWIDKTEKDGVDPVPYLHEVQYDKIIIAVLIADLVSEIKQELINRKVEDDKILQVNLKLIEDSAMLHES